MFASIRLEDSFLDRGGSGDELYLDSRLKAASWLAGLAGAPRAFDLDLDPDFVDDDADDFAGN